MTPARKPVTRETAAIVRGRPVIVTVAARTIELRLKGTRVYRFSVPIGELFESLEWKTARAKAAELRASRKRGRR